MARIGKGNSGRKKRDLSDSVNRAYDKANRLHKKLSDLEKYVKERSNTLETKLRRRKELTVTIQVRLRTSSQLFNSNI